jgi:predicted DNA-binding transcriptional regulator AlpA
VSELSKKIVPFRSQGVSADRLIVTMNAGEMRELIRQEVQAAGLNGVQADEWVDIKTAAKLMSVSAEWIYHNRKTLPFASKVGRRLLRFSRNGLQKWMESKKA